MPSAAAENPLATVLDPLLVSVGFRAGQGGGSTTTYCAAATDITDHYPYLPQADDEGVEDAELACVDLTFEVTGGRLGNVDFEDLGLERTLASVGAVDDAWWLLDAYGRPIIDVMAQLHDVLARLFDRGAHPAEPVNAVVDPRLAAAFDEREDRQTARSGTAKTVFPLR